MIVVRAVIGGVTAFAGVWTLADLSIVNPFPALVLGWTLFLLGLAIFAPAILDLFGVDQ